MCVCQVLGRDHVTFLFLFICEKARDFLSIRTITGQCPVRLLLVWHLPNSPVSMLLLATSYLVAQFFRNWDLYDCLPLSSSSSSSLNCSGCSEPLIKISHPATKHNSGYVLIARGVWCNFQRKAILFCVALPLHCRYAQSFKAAMFTALYERSGIRIRPKLLTGLDES